VANYVMTAQAILCTAKVFTWFSKEKMVYGKLKTRPMFGLLKRRLRNKILLSLAGGTAKRHNTFGLILGLLGCIGFIWVGSSMITD